MKTTVDVTRIYQDNLIEGATPIELVILLYDSAIHDLQRALAAMHSGDVQGRAASVSHALMVLQQLQGTLDFERGGSAARQFEHFYNLIRAKVLEAQMRGSPDLMREQVRYFTEVRDCWAQAKRLLETEARPAVAAGVQGSTSQWSA